MQKGKGGKGDFPVSVGTGQLARDGAQLVVVATFSSFTSCNPAILPSCNLRRSPPERHLNWLLNIGDLVALITAASAFREPVSVLQHADHGLHLLAVDLRRILLRV